MSLSLLGWFLYRYLHIFSSNIRTQRLWIRTPHLHCASLGQKVAFLTPNSSEYVVAQWAVWMCGGVVVPLCQSHPLDALRYIGVMCAIHT